MLKDLSKELWIAGVLIGLAIMVLNPYDMYMSDSMAMGLELCFVATVAFFVGIFWRERGGDERQQTHRMLADRAGFLAGLAVIALGVLIQGLNHDVDEWLVVTLVAMVLAKLGALMYGHLRR